MRLCLIGMLALSLAGGCSRADATAGVQASPSIPAAGQQRGDGAPYEILGTQVWNLPDPISGRDYQVFVHLPPSYGQDPDRRYPTLYVTDADYAFPIVRQIGRRLNLNEPRVEEFILVGLSYALGDNATASRTRDYTATAVRGGGGGPAYQTYLKTQVLPFIEQRFRSDPARRLLLGHSYGGLLGAQILFTEPELFSGYILGSPSFWHGNSAIFAAEAAYARSHADLTAHVYMYIGQYETLGPRPRHTTSADMVADNARMERLLKGRNYPGLTIRNETLNDEDHLSVAPRGFTHGLLELLPAH